MNNALENEICENTIEDNENDYTGDNLLMKHLKNML